MIDVTFMLSPLMILESYPTASRVITSNLEANKNINVSYNSSIITTNEMFNHKPKFNFPSVINSFFNSHKKYQFNHIILKNNKIRESIVNSVKTEIVLFSSSFIECLHIVKDLLNGGKKVVLGGAFCFTFDGQTIRKVLIDLGTDEDKINNIIVVKGYVDLQTDFVEIINNWKDITIKENKLSTIYECTDDFLFDYSDKIKELKFTPGIMTTFNQFCNYGKCKFCSWKLFPIINFIEDVDNDIIINNINILINKYKVDNKIPNQIFITDNYYDFNTKNIQIMEELKHYNFLVFSGINHLQSVKYIEYINKYVKSMFIGMETTIDSTLSLLNKGYNYENIIKACDNIIKYMDKSKFICFHVMLDLPMLKAKDIFLNFKRLKEIKERFISAGFFNFRYTTFPLFLNPTTKLVDNNLLRITKNPLSGENFILNHIENYPFLPDYISANFLRFDINGKQLLSDFQLIQNDFHIFDYQITDNHFI